MRVEDAEGALALAGMEPLALPFATWSLKFLSLPAHSLLLIWTLPDLWYDVCLD